MNQPRWPSLGDSLQYLQNLGFVEEPLPPRHIRYRHPEEGSWIVFPDQDRQSPTREIELLDMRAQLTGRGFVTDEEFAQFWCQFAVRPTGQPQGST